MFQTKSLKFAMLVACVAGLVSSAHAQSIRLHGAVAFAKVIENQRAALESKSGHKLEVVGNGSGRGLADLSGGLTDLALLSGPLDLVAEGMNKEKPGSVSADALKSFPVFSMKVAFVTHPSAGVKSVTDAQLRDVMTGKVKSWKDLGGADVPIKIVLPFGGDGVRLTAQKELLKGAEYASGAIIRNSAKDVAMVVSQVPGACALLTVQNVEGNVTKVPMETEFSMTFSLVTKGEPSADVKPVIDAITASIK